MARYLGEPPNVPDYVAHLLRYASPETSVQEITSLVCRYSSTEPGVVTDVEIDTPNMSLIFTRFLPKEGRVNPHVVAGFVLVYKSIHN